MNTEMLAMLVQLKARVVDVENIVKATEVDLEQYASHVDKLDDKLYELQVELENRIAKSESNEPGNVDPGEDDGPADGNVSVGNAPDSDIPESNGSTGEASGNNGSANKSASQDDGVSAASDTAALSEDRPAKAEGGPEEEEASSASTETKIGPLTITPEMKNNMKEGAVALGEVARDSREVISELAGAMGDIKDVFSFGPKPGRRR